MSFTVDLILTEVPENNSEAWAYIENLREEYYEDKSGPHQKLIKLHERLTERYPCLCDYEDDDPEAVVDPFEVERSSHAWEFLGLTLVPS